MEDIILFRTEARIRYTTRAGLTILIVLSVAFSPTAFAQSRRKEIPNFSQIPFFGDANPFERIFGGGDPGEIDALRRVSIPLNEERAYGERVLDAMQQDFRKRKIDVESRGEEVEYLRQLIEMLKPHMKNADRYRTIRVLVAQTKETDAYSIPGGTIVVYQGMIDFAGSEAALVGVLGHELSHLDRGHQLLPLQRSRSLQKSSRDMRIMSFDQFMKQASMFMSAFMRPFRPEDESEADLDGATWAYRSNYDPREMALLFARLHSRDRGGQFMPAFLRTHPYHADRQAAVQSLYHELQRAEPRSELAIGRENIRRRVPVSVRTLGE